MIGGLLVSAVGVLASSFATRIWMLYFTFGVMTGECQVIGPPIEQRILLPSRTKLLQKPY